MLAQTPSVDRSWESTIERMVVMQKGSGRDGYLPNAHHEDFVFHDRKLDIAEHLREPEQRPPIARGALRKHDDRPVCFTSNLLKSLWLCG